MKKIYGLQNDKEKISLIIVDDKPLLIIQTVESFKVRELNLQYDKEDLGVISADKFKIVNISANEITSENIDGTGEGENIVIDALQTNILAGKLDYFETKLKEKDEEISKLKDLIDTKVSSKEFWDFVKYYKDENDKGFKTHESKSKKGGIKKLFGSHNPNDVFKDVSINASGNIVYDDDGYIGVKTDSKNDKGEAQQKEQPKPVQRALKRIKEIDYITDVRIDEEFKATDYDMTENRLTITIDYLDVDIVKEMEKADKYKLY